MYSIFTDISVCQMQLVQHKNILILAADCRQHTLTLPGRTGQRVPDDRISQISRYLICSVLCATTLGSASSVQWLQNHQNYQLPSSFSLSIVGHDSFASFSIAVSLPFVVARSGLNCQNSKKKLEYNQDNFPECLYFSVAVLLT